MKHQIDRIDSISSLIGNTPLLELHFDYKGEKRTIFAKAEHYNMTGSIKDRIAYYIIKKAYETGELKKGDKIAEATSGNVGISISAVGRCLGHDVTIYMPDWMSEERIKLIKSYGASVQLLSKSDGGFLGCIRCSEELAENEENIFLTSQFANQDNCKAHYLTTGQEIWEQLQSLNLTPDGFVAGIGTGGTVMGVGEFMKEKKEEVKIFPLEPSSAPILSTGSKSGSHRIQGISDEFIPPIVHLDKLDDIISVDDGDAIIMAQKLASTLGLGVGISSGANFIGALKAQDILGKDSIITTVFPDDNKKYLSTDLMNVEPTKSHYLSPDIQLTKVIAHG